MRHRTAATVLGAAALAVGGLLPAVAGATSGQDAPSPGPTDPPPAVVEPVEPLERQLVIVPDVTAVAPGADSRVLVQHRIVNGTDAELPLELAVAGIDPATGRAATDIEVPVRVRLTADELQLAPGEAATVTSVASAVDVGAAYAVVAEVVGADPPVSIASVVLAAAGSSEVTVGAVRLSADRLEVELDVDAGPGLVDAAVRLRSWYGHTVLERSHGRLIAWSARDTLLLEYELEDVAVPGPYRVEVVAASGVGAPSRLTTTRWLFPAIAVQVLAGLAVLGSLAAVGMVWRRRRGRAADPGS